MVNSVTNLGRSGVFDWMIQRVTAYVLALYTLFMFGFLLTTDVSYASWSGLFDQTWFRIFTLLALLSIGGHAWVGLWTITTDYIKPMGARFIVQALCGLTMFVYLVWGIQILWGL
ncbi:succinate dehydrogenase, hydrophobic membrane anchor protein [Marinobacter koreensis]|jgi:succinate dehydrogenase / fumarate reductase membrane anchor subunit|uniref:Succinate dehydrogenase hydrophobic membrane anchor subunit n=2 Tax=Marinobacter TaxID=2742 RepID=M7DG92_9GAMM|nr:MULTISPECIES: succinate dehydrogenase, hydrophobic membrane anchor protein [Marinobacter]EMP56692.1 succinate dehydrogenase, membrane subunit, binds cytochrome b556 [Marinobacter santoriniensis NKSG1]MCK7548288.1 succinate dehydrogenase, hydrophobic membrane anchor protein [Marinobacter koreensis]MDX1816821.1 succinate dehydrogenase, hydrophobic membrane anchor protein [Marinobacter sp.]